MRTIMVTLELIQAAVAVSIMYMALAGEGEAVPCRGEVDR